MEYTFGPLEWPRSFPRDAGEALIGVLRGVCAHLLSHSLSGNDDPPDIIIGMRCRNASPAMHYIHAMIQHTNLEFVIQFFKIGELLHLRRVPDNGFRLMGKVGPAERTDAR